MIRGAASWFALSIGMTLGCSSAHDAEIAALRAEIDVLRAELHARPECPDTAGDEAVPEARVRISPELDPDLSPLLAACIEVVNLRELAVHYGARHPRVVEARARLEAARGRLADAAPGEDEVAEVQRVLGEVLARDRYEAAERSTSLGEAHPSRAAASERLTTLERLLDELASSRTCSE